jgi:N-acetylglucosamine-6-phosphate deacetylase
MKVGSDQIVRQPGKTNFAGSALRPIDGIFRAAEMLNCSWHEVWPRFSERPAQLVGLKNNLAVGNSANFCLLKFAGNKFQELEVVTTS